jgi:hypothetical protein
MIGYATRFKCVVCGKLTAGRLPVNPHNHRERGDGTFWYPRRHKGKDGEPCPGNIEEAQIIEVKQEAAGEK